MLTALASIIIPLVLLVLLRMPARYGMPVATLAVALLGSAVWGISGQVLVASSLQGIHRAGTIIWILLGALAFLYVMQHTGSIERIKQGFMKVSADMRVQTVLVAFALVSIIEGVSGFGTPAAIAVPLLLALGFRPLTAVVLALMGDSVATSFGALGTPLSVGLSNVEGANLTNIGNTLTIVDSLFAVILPLVLTIVLVLWFGRKSDRRQDIVEILPWTLLVGASYAITAFLGSRLIGIEFTSVVSGAVALIVAVLTARWKIWIPKNVWRHHARAEEQIVRHQQPTMSLGLAGLPYVLIIMLLLVQRTLPIAKDFSQSVLNLSWNGILGFENISSVWYLLYSPGTILLLVAVLTLVLHGVKWRVVAKSSRETMRATGLATLALVPTLIMVQIFANSGLNDNGLLSMPNYIAKSFAEALGPIWLAVAPLLGTLTAFITGSSTVSSLTIAQIQYGVAVQLNLPTDLALAQQISGANAGNVIAIHNVVAASAVAGMHHQEGRVIRHTMPVVLIYLTCTVIVSLLVLIF